jgi:hypothetical protein
MTTFAFTELVNSPMADVVSAALGASSSAKLNDNDVGKPVKMGSAQNYVVCSAGDEIEGFVVNVEANTVNDGFSFGSVIRNKRVIAKVDAAQVGTLAVGEYAIAGASAALGTADAYPKVKEGTPTNFKWRCIRIISGTGVAGDLVLLEKI